MLPTPAAHSSHARGLPPLVVCGPCSRPYLGATQSSAALEIPTPRTPSMLRQRSHGTRPVRVSATVVRRRPPCAPRPSPYLPPYKIVLPGEAASANAGIR